MLHQQSQKMEKHGQLAFSGRPGIGAQNSGCGAGQAWQNWHENDNTELKNPLQTTGYQLLQIY